MNRLMVGPDYEQLRDTLTHIEHGQNLRFETESVGEPLLILSSGLKVKRFPNCGSAHRAMDGLLELIERARLRRRRGRGDPRPRPGHPPQQSDVRRTRRTRCRPSSRSNMALACSLLHRQLHARRFHRRGGDAPRGPRALSAHPPPSGRQGRGRVPDRGRSRARATADASRPRSPCPSAASPRRFTTRADTGPSSTAAPRGLAPARRAGAT